MQTSRKLSYLSGSALSRETFYVQLPFYYPTFPLPLVFDYWISSQSPTTCNTTLKKKKKRIAPFLVDEPVMPNVDSL